MRWFAGLLLLAATPAAAVDCDTIEHLGISFTACEVAAAENLQLFLRDDAGDILGSFGAIERNEGNSASPIRCGFMKRSIFRLKVPNVPLPVNRAQCS